MPHCDDCGVREGKMHHVLCARRELNKGLLPRRRPQARGEMLLDTTSGIMSLEHKIARLQAQAWVKKIDRGQRGGFRQEMRHARH
jgi:hypothetical protein